MTTPPDRPPDVPGDNFQGREKRRAGERASAGGINGNGSRSERGVISVRAGPSDGSRSAFIAGIGTKYPLTCQAARRIRGVQAPFEMNTSQLEKPQDAEGTFGLRTARARQHASSWGQVCARRQAAGPSMRTQEY